MKPRISALDRRTAIRLAATEYQCCAELLRSLDSHSWSRSSSARRASANGLSSQAR